MRDNFKLRDNSVYVLAGDGGCNRLTGFHVSAARGIDYADTRRLESLMYPWTRLRVGRTFFDLGSDVCDRLHELINND